MTKLATPAIIDQVALVLVNAMRVRHNIAPLKTVEDMRTYLTEDALAQYREMSSAAIEVYEAFT